MMAIGIDPTALRIAIDELTDALIRAVALGAYAIDGTTTEAPTTLLPGDRVRFEAE